MLEDDAFVPDVYTSGNDILARGKARNPSNVLDEKFAYMGGKEVRAKQNARYSKVDDFTTHFAQTYDNFPTSQRSQEKGADAFAEVTRILPDLFNRNIHVAAAAMYIINDIGVKSADQLKPDDFDQSFNRIWSKLHDSLYKSKRDRSTQKQDVLRYVLAILNFMNE